MDVIDYRWHQLIISRFDLRFSLQFTYISILDLKSNVALQFPLVNSRLSFARSIYLRQNLAYRLNTLTFSETSVWVKFEGF